MSLKAIELQVALPRTQDAGKLQEQLQQRSQIGQDLAAREMQKEAEKHEKAVIKNSRKDKLRLKGRQSAMDGQFESEDLMEAEDRNKQQSGRHPYKGTAIDYTG